MNTIKEAQDQPENLRLLAAQRAVYIRAKRFFSGQLILTVLFAVLFNIVRLAFKEQVECLTQYMVAVSVLSSLLEPLFFAKVISALKTNAARIQELFDCSVFGLSWNQYNSGKKPDPNFIHDAYKRYRPDPENPIENWYDLPLDGLSQEQAVLLCQETNLWYDGKLREYFKRDALRVLLAMAAICFLIGLATGLSLGLLLTYTVAPVLPAVGLFIKIYLENEKSIKASEELKALAVSIRGTTNAPTEDILRKIQDKIYCSRKDGALVPDWYYEIKRKKLEVGMKVNASNQ